MLRIHSLYGWNATGIYIWENSDLNGLYNQLCLMIVLKLSFILVWNMIQNSFRLTYYRDYFKAQFLSHFLAL